MTQQREYRYTPTPGPCPDHPHCLILRCSRWLCTHTFHLPLNQPGQPRATATKPAESPNIGGFTCDLSTPKGGDF